MKKLSSYAAKVRAGICPFRYGALHSCPPMRPEEAKRYEAEAWQRTYQRNAWRISLVRIVRHQGIVDGARRLLPLTMEEQRALR